MIGEGSASREFGRGGLIACALAAGTLTVSLSVVEGGASPLALGALGAIVWGCLLVGLIFGLLPVRPLPGGAILAGGALLALAILTGLSIGWASDQGRAFIELARVLAYLGIFVLVLVASPRGSARAWLGGFAGGLAVVALLALGSRLLAPGSGIGELAELPTSTVGRLDFPVGYWNALGAMMGAAAVLFAWAATHAHSRLLRSCALALFPLAGLTIFFTESRGAIAAAVLGLLVLIALSPRRVGLSLNVLLGLAGVAALVAFTLPKDELVDGLPSAGADTQGIEVLIVTIVVVALVAAIRLLADPLLQRARLPAGVQIGLAGLVAVALLAGVVAADPGERWAEFKEPPPLVPEEGLGRLASSAGTGRYQFWSAAGDAFSSEPLRGIGAGTYEFWWNQNGTTTAIVRNAHSLPLETLAELGAIGGVCLGAFAVLVIGSAGIPAKRRTSEGEIGAALAVFLAIGASATIDWTWEFPAVAALMIGTAALLTGAATRARPEEGPLEETEQLDRKGSAGAGPRRAALALTAALALAGSAAAWIVVLGESRLSASERLTRDDDLPAAAAEARAASSIQPWSPEPWLQLALVQELGGDLQAGRSSIREAISRSPEDWRLRLVQSRLETAAGNLRAGERALSASQRLYPRATLFDRLELVEPADSGQR